MKHAVKKQNIILLILFALLIIVPLALNPGGEYGGTDGNAEVAIEAINPSYTPWFEPFWEPPSGEIESLMFTLLAVVGASTIGYYVGYIRGRNHD
jgi:cobalt/nickel transport protein